ncbi:MAG: hypothetical protein IPN46_09380 [Saprospiraceae bacterium]|nr:hypothetical protein [Saprospiraceae bacterium]
MQRDNTGKFRLFLNLQLKEKLEEIVEDGTWWIENGLFYEYHNSSKLTDTYKYIVINSIWSSLKCKVQTLILILMNIFF